ncbi:hypothetical protein [Clostridium pasteurianum]|uniref:Uncharacterized protein n=1 Tax=Clostridium pasteurianum BC1 TaxID=86416 RepID=R4KAV7_CLOPA|nr:hypothetical protein [Clostridium pasteurianum]AGK97649.1 hypothetical protein Clopa_2811 [Clostridium pasteurianum BC1]
MELGLNVKNATTKDIITINFKFGYTPNFEKSLDRIKELQKDNKEMFEENKNLENQKKSISKRVEKRPILDSIKKNKDSIRNNKAEIKSIKEDNKKSAITKNVVRDKLYKDGFKLDFYKKDRKTKEYKLDGTIYYKFWFRTPSKSRVGDVMFINTKLLDNIRVWQRMGLKLPKGKAKIVEMMAYESLTSSHIESKITINPSNILCVNDIDSFFKTNCAIVNVNENGECYVKHGLNEVKNTLFDGQALLEDELFTGNEGMMLLRQHFFKACGFRTRIRQFMKDWCEANGKDYNTYTVPDRYNNDIKVKDILMITTENAMKWEKFSDLGANYDYWKQKVNEDNNVFGICKVDHASKWNDKQRMSYQMVNTLFINQSQTDELADYTINYVDDIKDSNDKYMDFLKITASTINGNDMITDLCKRNKLFEKSYFYREYKNKDISKYVKTLRNGKLLAEGDNLTICGNPYVMLLHSVKQVPVQYGVLDKDFEDPTLPISKKYISVYTKRFEDGEMLSAFRNPHNSPNNIGYHKNYRNPLMEKYFNFSKNIMAVNLISTEEQDLKNGLDQDSDFCYVTNEKVICEATKKVFRKFPCIVNKIPKKNKPYENTIENYSKVDNDLAQAKYDIGLSSNLAQLAMSWYHDKPSEELADIVCIMSVLAQVAIDNSKRQYAVVVSDEIDRIRDLEYMQRTTTNDKDHEVKARPYFWQYVSKKVKKDSLIWCDCPMNYLQNSLDKIKNADRPKDSIDNTKFIQIQKGKENDRQLNNIQEAIKKYDDKVKKHNDLIADGTIEEDEEKWTKKQTIMQKDVVDYVKGLEIKEKTMQILIGRALSENGMDTKYKKKLLNALYQAHKDTFLTCFIENK